MLLSTADVGFILGAFILIAALVAFNIYLARIVEGGEWLFLRWNGARAFLFEQIEPYGSTIAQRVQMLAYGHEAFLNEYPFALNDPFYIVLLYSPLALFSDFAIAQGIWMSLSQAALIGIVFLSLSLAEWQPPRWMFIFLIGLALLGYFSLTSFISASPAIFLTLIYLLILVSLRSDSDELAGALLFLVAYQWEVGALFFLFILVFVWMNRRWNVPVGFGMALLVLMIVSVILDSDWPLPYIRAVFFDSIRGTDYTFATTLSYIFPNLINSAGRWITAVVTTILLFESIRMVSEHFSHVAWVAFLALALNPMLGFPIFSSDHVALLPAFILVIALVWERWERRRAITNFLLFGLAIFLPFGLHFQGLQTPDRLYSDLLKILPPILAVIGLFWMRWWAVRPPRIWADQFGMHK